MVKVIKHTERDENEEGCSVTMRGGERDGLEFRMVKAEMSDGNIRWLWACNVHDGYFKQVFVPWDFEHHAIK